MLTQTLRELQVTPAQTVMVGDELLVDIRIPKGLGMRAILLDRLRRFKRLPFEADEKATTLGEALAIVVKWSARASS